MQERAQRVRQQCVASRVERGNVSEVGCAGGNVSEGGAGTACGDMAEVQGGGEGSSHGTHPYLTLAAATRTVASKGMARNRSVDAADGLRALLNMVSEMVVETSV